MLVLTQVQNPSWFQFLLPFSWSLWAVILSIAVVFAVSLFVFERRKNETEFTYDTPHQNAVLRYAV